VKAIAAIAAEQATAFRRIVFILFIPSLWPLWAINAGASGFDFNLLFATYEDDWRTADLGRLYFPLWQQSLVLVECLLRVVNGSVRRPSTAFEAASCSCGFGLFRSRIPVFYLYRPQIPYAVAQL
jgi:hypothetical protein